MLATLKRWLFAPSARVPESERSKVYATAALTFFIGLAILISAFAGTPSSRPTLRVMIFGIVPAYVLCRTRYHLVGAVLALLTTTSFSVLQALVAGEILDTNVLVFHRFAWMTLTVAFASLLFSARGVLVVTVLADVLVVSIALLSPNVAANAIMPALLFISIMGCVLYLDTSVRARHRAELIEARDAAHSATRAKSQFLSNMSHELRTPLNAVIGMSELLRECDLAPEQREYAETIHRGGTLLMAIINDVLDVAKIEASQLDIAEQPFNVRECIGSSVHIVANLAANKGLELEATVADDVPDQVLGDQLRVQQILMNLLHNAVKFTDQGRVTLTVAVHHPMSDDDPADQDSVAHASDADAGQNSEAQTVYLRLSVTDTGIGIAPEALTDLFQPFVQADSSSTRRHGGTGLGLVICRHLAQLMGGRIWAESVAGEGSTFHVVMRTTAVSNDIRPIESADHDASELDARMALAHPLRILLAEDNALNRKVAMGMLARLGYRADVANNGVQALEMVLAAPYDVVLMDMQMPEMDGLEATRRIRAHAEVAQQPRIVAMTADVLDDARDRARAAGMDDYVAKPVQLEHLAQALRACRGL